MHEETLKAAKKPGAILGMPADSTGPVGADMGTYNPGHVPGFVVRAFGEVSTQVRDFADLVACVLSAEHPALFEIAKYESKQISKQQIQRSIGLAVNSGLAKTASRQVPGREKPAGSYRAL